MKSILKKIYVNLPYKKQLFQLIRLFNIPKSIYQHLYFNGVFKIKFENYQFLIKHYGYQVENDIFWSGLSGGWEKESLKIWVELCKDSNTVIDVGANTGIYSLIAKSIKPCVRTYAFEPVHRVFEKLKFNCAINNFNIECIEEALSNYDGDAVIYDSNSDHTYSVTVNKNLYSDVNAIECKIKTKKLSTFIKENAINNIDLMKIDVETHEAEVLEGMGEYLELFQPTMLIEILNDDVGKNIQKILNNIDYLFFIIDELNGPQRVLNITKNNCNNYNNFLICKKEVAQKLYLI